MPAEEANPLFARVLSTRGVRYVTLIGPDNAVLGSAGTSAPDASFVQAAKAVAQSLSATVGGEAALQDLMIDLSGGPVLLTPQKGNLLVVGFDEVGNLGRVRFAVKREINKL